MSLSYLPRPDFLEFTLPDTHIVLITSEGTSLSTEVFDQVARQGFRPVLLNLPGQNPIKNRAAVHLKVVSDEAIAQAVAEVEKQFGKVGSFIHLHPHFEFQNGQFAQHFQTEKNLLKTVFLLAKHLKTSLTELGQKQRANFLTVTRLDGQLGLGKRGNTSILGGGLNGLVKCLNLEWPSVFCRAVDLQPEWTAQQLTQHILAEFHGADLAIQEVGVSAVGRQTIRAREVDVAEKQSISTSVHSNSVFLVSGGARGITATCVLEMAAAFQCKFILLGRSSNDFELPAYALTTDNEAQLKRLIMDHLKAKGEQVSLAKVKTIFKQIIAKKEIQATLDQIAQHGAQGQYVQTDVTAAGLTASRRTSYSHQGPV
ncbi:MAG: hypothetical protein AAGD05_04270 [Bacteroidota bacterium]